MRVEPLVGLVAMVALVVAIACLYLIDKFG